MKQQSTFVDFEDELINNTSQFQTGSSIADKYLERRCGAEIKKSTAEKYECCLIQYVKFVEESDTQLLEMKTRDIKEFFRETARNNLSRSMLKSRMVSVSGLYEAIHTEMEHTPEVDIIALNKISLSDFNTRNIIERRPLSEPELEKLCNGLEDDRDRLMILLASEIGVRNESLRLIKIGDVDLDEDIVYALNTKSGGQYRMPISNQMALNLERWLEVEREAYDENPSNPYLFPSRRGGNLKYNTTLWKIVHNAAEKAGIQEVVDRRKPTKAERRVGVKKDMIEYYRITPHLLRHTFSHLLDQAGLNTKQRRDALDHANESTTEKHYTYSKTEYEDLIRRLVFQDK